jgi:hypothetical protein
MHHLDGAAREAERHRPQAAGLRPADQLVELRDDETLVLHFVSGGLEQRILLHARRQRRALCFDHSHSSAPFRHS